jgi:hypothetical protein
LSKSTFTVERHKKVLTQVKKSDVRTPKTGKIKNQHYAKVSLCSRDSGKPSHGSGTREICGAINIMFIMLEKIVIQPMEAFR